jgi:hypothetical protein
MGLINCWEGFRKQVLEVGSGTVMYVTSFIEIGSGFQNLIRGTPRHRVL